MPAPGDMAPDRSGRDLFSPGPRAPVSGRRFLALHLPHLATEGLGPGPLLLWQAVGPRRQVTAVDPAAAAQGLYPGQPLADAQALLPQLLALPEDPARAAARLQALALHLLRFTPLVACNPPDGLLLDITGAAHLFGGEEALMRRAARALAQLGHRRSAALAGTAQAAAALARAGRHGTCLPTGQEAAALAPLPLEALRLPPEMLPRLHKLGLRRIGQLLEQPRGPLARRFGRDLLALLDAATGAAGSSIRPVAAPAVFAASREFLEPLLARAGIDAALAVLLPELCEALAAAGMGLRRLCLQALRVDGGLQEIRLGTGAPVRAPRHLARLLQEKLEHLEPGFGFERLSLLVEHAEPLATSQADLACNTASDTGPALAQLVDRLAQRLPVWRPQPRASHWPERAVVRASPFAPVQRLEDWAAPDRPVRLLSRPEVIEADTPPSQVVWRGRPHRIRHAAGPERLEPEWWRDRPDRPSRDYFLAECEDGTRLWICRGGADAQRWFLHGFFA
jgi:protein ImuB